MDLIYGVSKNKVDFFNFIRSLFAFRSTQINYSLRKDTYGSLQYN